MAVPKLQTTKIQKAIPVPSSPAREYPFAELEVGDSFEVPAEKFFHARGAAAAYRNAHPGWQYVSRKTESGGLRIWRKA